MPENFEKNLTPEQQPESKHELLHVIEPDGKLSPTEISEEVLQEQREKKQIEKEIRDWAKITIQEWREKVHPDYIFLAETAAISYGYVLKEAWKSAYPEKECPDFYRIDPRAIYGPEISRKKEIDEEVEKGLKKYYSKRIKKDNANIVIFDEGGRGGKNWLKACDFSSKLLSVDSDSTYSISPAMLHLAYEKYIDKKEGTIWVENGGPSGAANDFLGGLGADRGKGISNRPTSKLYGYGHPSSYRPESEDEKMIEEKRRSKGYKEGEFTLAGAIVKHPEQKKRTMTFIRELRRIGREAGQELNRELKKEE